MNHSINHLRRVTAPPTVLRDGKRLVIIDDAVLELLRGTVPASARPARAAIRSTRPSARARWPSASPSWRSYRYERADPDDSALPGRRVREAPR